MRFAVVLGPPLMALACSQEVVEHRVKLDLPLQGSERAVVLAVESVTRGPLLFRALPIDDGPPLAEVAISEGTVVVTALLYRETLTELGLAAGDLERSVPAYVRSRELPAASRIVAARVSDGVSSPFSSQSQVTGFLLDARVRETGPECATFETRAVPLGDRHKVHFVLGVGRGGLIANDAKELAYVTLEGRSALKGPGFEIFDAFLNGTDELWLAGEGGRIFQGRLQPEGCTRVMGRIPCTSLRTTLVGTSPRGVDLLRISGAATGTVAEVFMVSNDRYFERFDTRGRFFEPSYRIPGHDRIGSCSVARVSEGEAVAGCFSYDEFSYDESSVVRWKDGTLTLESLPASSVGMDPESVTAATHVPAFGTLIGTWSGEVLKNVSGATWEHLGARFTTRPILSLVGHEDSFFLLDSGGRVAQLLPNAAAGWRYCSPYPAKSGAPDDPRDLTLVGRDLVAAGHPVDDAAEGYLRWLVRRE